MFIELVFTGKKGDTNSFRTAFQGEKCCLKKAEHTCRVTASRPPCWPCKSSILHFHVKVFGFLISLCIFSLSNLILSLSYNIFLFYRGVWLSCCLLKVSQAEYNVSWAAFLFENSDKGFASKLFWLLAKFILLQLWN